MMNGAYIKGEMVRELLDLLIGKGELQDREYTIYRNYFYDDASYACGNEDELEKEPFDFVVIPRVLMDGEDNRQNEFILSFQSRYGFDYEEFMAEYGLNYWEMQVAHSLLHEIGHIIDADNDIKKNGWLKENKEDMVEYEGLLLIESKISKIKVWEKYREIRGEVKADKKAIELLTKYTNEIVDIIKSGVLICSESELTIMDGTSEEKRYFGLVGEEYDDEWYF